MQNGTILAGAAALALLAGCQKAEAPAPADTTTTEVPVETVPAETAGTDDAPAGGAFPAAGRG